VAAYTIDDICPMYYIIQIRWISFNLYKDTRWERASVSVLYLYILKVNEYMTY